MRISLKSGRLSISFLLGLFLSGLLALNGLSAGFVQTNLVADEDLGQPFTDANLLNAWGLYVDRTGHLVVVNNHSDSTTFYKANGAPTGTPINVEEATDLAANYGRSFPITKEGRTRPSRIIFVTEGGTIEGWNSDLDRSNSVVAVDNSATGANYKGIALGSGGYYGSSLFAADFHNGVVEMYDGNFHFVRSFTDTNLTAIGFAPFGIRNLGGKLYVAFAKQLAPDNTDEQPGPSLGYVDIFDLKGRFVRRFASEGTLNAPWGLALARGGFGEFSHAVLVGNFGDGAITAYNARTGAPLGQVTDAGGNVIHIEGLWGISFGVGTQGHSLYFAAGPDDENHGLVGYLKPAPRRR